MQPISHKKKMKKYFDTCVSTLFDSIRLYGRISVAKLLYIKDAQVQVYV